MKPTLLLATALLSFTGSSLAQKGPTTTPPGLPATTPPSVHPTPPAAAANDANSLTLQLAAGTLRTVVAELERQVAAPGSAETMPNVIYSPGTEDMEVPTQLRLRRVSPVQALTLVAAAAGCVLEPVTVPPLLKGDKAAGEVAGYRMVKMPAAMPAGVKVALPASPELEELRDKLEATQRTLAAGHPDIKRLREEMERLEKVKEEVLHRAQSALSGNTTIRVVEPLPGVHGSGNFLVERSMTTKNGSGPATTTTTTTSSSASTGGKPATTVTVTTAPGASAVRIYAIAALTSGQSEAEAKKTQASLDELITSALAKADLDRPGPELSFHQGTKVLVAKANPAQQEIISQVLTALKENQGTAAAPLKP